MLPNTLKDRLVKIFYAVKLILVRYSYVQWRGKEKFQRQLPLRFFKFWRGG